MTRVLNKKYWPFRVTLPREYKQIDPTDGFYDPRVKWLDENMPEQDKFRWIVTFAGQERTYYFREEKDLLLFTLRWAG